MGAISPNHLQYWPSPSHHLLLKAMVTKETDSQKSVSVAKRQGHSGTDLGAGEDGQQPQRQWARPLPLRNTLHQQCPVPHGRDWLQQLLSGHTVWAGQGPTWPQPTLPRSPRVMKPFQPWVPTPVEVKGQASPEPPPQQMGDAWACLRSRIPRWGQFATQGWIGQGNELMTLTLNGMLEGALG